jgi:hypothetical protein
MAAVCVLRLRSRGIVIAEALAAVTIAGGLFPGDRAPDLERLLPTPVAVYCTTDTGGGYAHIGYPEVFLGRSVCGALRSKPDKWGGPFAWSVEAFVLYHEWWHVALAERNEVNTDLGALAILRSMFRRFWGMTPAQAQKHYEIVAGRTHYAGDTYKATATDQLLEVNQ